MRCFTRYDGRPNPDVEQLKLSTFANENKSIVRCEFSVLALAYCVIYISALFQKGKSMSLLVAQMADIGEDMVLSYFLFHNSLQTYQYYIQAAKFLLQRAMLLNFLWRMLMERRRKLGRLTPHISTMDTCSDRG